MPHFNTKPWYKSRTLWIAGCQVIGGILLVSADYLGSGGALTLSGLLAIWLRIVTKYEVEL